MRYEEWTPSADLARHVQCLWELQGTATALAEPIFPDGRVELVVHLSDLPRARGTAHLQPRAMIVGQMLTATRLEPVTHVHAVGVRFTPTGARAWLRLPLHELTGRIEEAGAVCGVVASQLRSAVEQGTTTKERFAAAESVIRRTLRADRRPSDAIRHAVRVIERRGGMLTVDIVARACELGPRQLERRFLEEVGIAPKAMVRIARFQRALRRLRAGVPPAMVAASCGFADQPHLAREFRRIAGLPAGAVDLTHVAFLQDGVAGPPAHS